MVWVMGGRKLPPVVVLHSGPRVPNSGGLLRYKAGATVSASISQLQSVHVRDKTGRLLAPMADHGRCGCFHFKWKQPGAVVCVWSSRVGFVLHGANSAHGAMALFSATEPGFQLGFLCASRPPLCWFVCCVLVWFLQEQQERSTPARHPTKAQGRVRLVNGRSGMWA